MRLFDFRRFLPAAVESEHPRLVEILGEPGWLHPSFTMLSCDAKDQVACTAAARGWKGFETPLPELICDALLRSGDGCFIDVGANTGFYTLLALAVSSRTSIYAYEPLPSVRKILKRNLLLNKSLGGRTRVSVSSYAASDSAGIQTLFVPRSVHGFIETSASLSGTFKESIDVALRVKATTLDREHEDGRRVAVLKVDAEGHDLHVLLGAQSILMKHRPVVFVEVLPGADPDLLTDLLNRVGYEDVILRPDEQTPPSRTVRYDPDGWNHMWLPDAKSRRG